MRSRVIFKSKIQLFILLSLLVIQSAMSAQDIQIDYKKDRNLRLNRTFTENYKVSILNFDKTSDLIVTDQSGDIIKIDSKDLRGYNYDSKLKRLVLMIEIGNGYLFINKDSLELGDLVFSASGETLLHISRIKKPETELVSIAGKSFKPAGFEFLDALAFLNCDSVTVCIDILSSYFDIPSSVKNISTLKSFLKTQDNEFLKDTLRFFPVINNKRDNLDFDASISGGSEKLITISSLASSQMGSINITNIADGFAKFIVKRTKQELNIAFFEKFKQEMDSIKDLQTLFPQTYRTLSAIGEDIYMFEAYIQTLRESFEKDLATLPSNLPSIIENHQAYFDQVPELKGGLLTAFYLAEAIQNKDHPGEIIENYDESIWDSIQNVKAVFQTLKLFSTSLRSNGESVYWVSYSEIKKLTTDETLLNIYLGLVLQKARKEGIKFEIRGEDKFLADLMNEGYITLQPYKTYINNLAPKIQSIENRIKKVREVQSDSLLFENYYNLVSSSVDLMKYASQIDKLPILVKYNLKLEEKTKLYFEMAQTGADIAIDVNRRNYASAIVNLVHLYDQAIAKWNISTFEYKKAISKIKEATGIDISDLTKSYSEIPNEIIIKLSDEQLKYLRTYFDELRYHELYKANINRDAVDKILRYGSFMAAVAQAKSPDDVEAAIEAVALPTGSARIKRETLFNVALNAYSGFYIGHEDMKFSLQNGRLLNSYGITAPIGLTINWGSNRFLWMPRHREGHFSHSVFITAIDIGAIASFRFVDDTTKTLSKIELRDIISPGIFYSMGIPKTPLSVNLGYQITPYLREVSSSLNTFKNSYSRFSISLCVDIPLLNFYTKSK